ncbi:MAG: glycoside hydrolase family 172 protein, partial [Natronospirillum sp.]
AQYLRKLVFEMYWDGSDEPSVRVPLGDFFGVGHATGKHWWSLPMNTTFGDRRGPKGPFSPAFNSYWPMPFGEGARIQIVNEANEPIENLFYYIDYELYQDGLPEDFGRFHAVWHRENPTDAVPTEQPYANPAPWDLGGNNLTGDDNYVVLDVRGTGHYVGCVLNIDNFNASNQEYTWPGEGDDMIFIDDEEWPPSLHGTGTEDYFGCSWGFPSGEHSTPYHGISLAADPQEHFGKWSLYRFHIEDPVHFSKSIKVTFEHGHANDQSNDYSSVGFFYTTEPVPAKALPPVEERLARRWPEHGLWDC